MSDEQVQKMKDYLDDEKNYDEETYIHDGKNAFFGDISNHDGKLFDFLTELGVYKFAEILS